MFITQSWLVRSRINIPRPKYAAYRLPQFDSLRYYPALRHCIQIKLILQELQCVIISCITSIFCEECIGCVLQERLFMNPILEMRTTYN